MALKGMIMKCTMIKTYWRLSKWDALVWIVTFFTTVFVDISIGLGAGVVVSLFSVFIQGYTPYACLLGVVPNTDLYLDVKRYKGVSRTITTATALIFIPIVFCLDPGSPSHKDLPLLRRAEFRFESSLQDSAVQKSRF